MNICQEMDSKVRGRSSFDLILNEKFQVGYQVMEMDYETEETKTKLNDIHKPSKLEKRVRSFIENILDVALYTFEFSYNHLQLFVQYLESK